MRLRVEVDQFEITAYANKHKVSFDEAYQVCKEHACATMRKAYGSKAGWWKEGSYTGMSLFSGLWRVFTLDFYPSANEALLDAPENNP